MIARAEVNDHPSKRARPSLLVQVFQAAFGCALMLAVFAWVFVLPVFGLIYLCTR